MKKIIAILLILMILLASCNVKSELNTPQLRDDNAVTDEIREQFFDFAIKNRIDMMPEIVDGSIKALKKDALDGDIEYINVYVVALNFDAIVEYDSGLPGHHTAIPVKTAQKVLKEKFGVEYDFPQYDKYDKMIPLAAESIKGNPIYEVLQYSQNETEEGILVSARLAEYFYNEYEYEEFCYDKSLNPKIPDDFKDILKGESNNRELRCYTNIEYLTDKDGNFIKFVTCYDEAVK